MRRNRSLITFLIKSNNTETFKAKDIFVSSSLLSRQKLHVRCCSVSLYHYAFQQGFKPIYYSRSMSSNSNPRSNRESGIDQLQHPVNLEVLFYIPNIIGYGRILLACIAFTYYQDPTWFILFYSSSIILDGLDGYTARKLNQCSKFGAWFDVIIDLFSRGYLWCALFKGGYLIVFLEWVTFVSTHSRGENWKIPDEKFPTLVKLVMENGFKTPAGFFAVGSLHVLPLWFYCYESRFFTQTLGMPMWLQLSGIVILAVGRTVCAAVELFYCKEYVADLLRR